MKSSARSPVNVRVGPAAMALTMVFAAAGSGDLLAQPAPTPGMTTMSLPPKPAVLERSLRFQKIRREQGLPQNSVFSIAQDRAGFIWLGTQQGLVRFDGQRSRVFRHAPDDPKSLGASWVTKVLVASDGTVWVGTHGGLHRYEPNSATFQRFLASESPDALKSGIILSLAEGADGKIWVGTAAGGVSLLDPATSKIRTFTAVQGLAVPAVLADKSGEVWVGTDAGVQRLDSKKGIFEPVLPDTAELTISALYRDRSGTLWVGTAADGLRRYPPGKAAIVYGASDEPGNENRKLADNTVKAILEDRDGRLWVGSETALHVFDPSTDGFRAHYYVAEDSRSIKPPVEALYQDRAGALWVGTVGDGAAILDPLALRFHFYRGHTFVLAERGDELWTASAETEETCRWRGKTTLQGSCYKTGSWAIRVFVDSKGTAWVSTLAGGLLRLDAGSGDRWIYYTNDPKDPNSISPGVSAVAEDRRGNIWVSTFGGGVQRLQGRGHRFVTAIESPSSQIYAIEEDPKQDGLFWLTTAGDGLIAYDSNEGKVTHYKPRADEPENKTDNAVVMILFDGDQHIWLATFGGGLKRLDRTTGKFKSYRVAEGMPSDSVYSILRDGSGKLWASTVAGLARFDPKTETFAVFTEDDGLQGDEFGMLSGFAAKDGRLLFGGLNGFTVFKPEEIEVDKNSPPVQVTGIRVLGKRYGGDTRPEAVRTISIAYNETQLSFDLATLAFSGSQRTTFEYQLEGLNDRWVTLESPSLGLTGLDDGDYRLLLRARNRHGIASEATSIALSIAPPFWRTWWAYSIYGLAFLALLFGVYRYQQARIDRLEKLGRLAVVEQQFEMTATVQKWFLPPSPRYTSGGLDLMGFYRAADKCSGDWWWYERVAPQRLWIIVADVTGHGVAPAMLTAAVAMGLGVQSNKALATEEDVLDRLSKINKEVLSRCKGHQHMTMTSVLIDEATGALNVFTLGGLPAVLLDSRGKHRVIGARGIPLGSAEVLEVGKQSATMQTGERLLIATDGIIEANLPGGRQFGFRRFVQLTHTVRELPVDHAVAHMVREIDKVRGGERQDDDFTLCLFERRGNGSMLG